MEKTDVQAFRRALSEKLRALGIETTELEGFGPPQIGGTLRVLLPISDREVVITDFLLFTFETDNDLLQLYTTVLAELGDDADMLTKRLVEWNAVCPLGHFGIPAQERRLYHRYTLPVEKRTDPGALADRALLLLSLVREIVAGKYPEAAPFAKGG